MIPTSLWDWGIYVVAAWIAISILAKMMQRRREFLVDEMRNQIDLERERLREIVKKKKRIEAQRQRQAERLGQKAAQKNTQQGGNRSAA